MKRATMLIAVTTVVLAVTSTPALAAGLPYGDTDPSHYAGVIQGGFDYNAGNPSWAFDDACTSTGCEFSATARDFVHTLDQPTGQAILTCDEVSLDYSIEKSLAYITEFDIVDVHWETAQCDFYPWEREQAVCAYNPDGDFGSYETEIEYWLRDDYGSGEGSPEFEPAFGKITGRTDWSPQIIEVESVVFDDQFVFGNSSQGIDSWTVDGIIDINDDISFETEASSCTAFPELAS